ncbi:terpene synthase family protein [Amycolatopsis sp. NPDC054798]
MPIAEHALPPGMDDARNAHLSWLRRHELLASGAATDRYVKSRLADVAAYCDPASRDLVLSYHVLGWTFLHDDWMDVAADGAADLAVTSELVAILHRPSTSAHPLASAFSDLWAHLRSGMSEDWRHRAAWLWQEYFYGNFTETVNRREGREPTSDEHLRIKDTSVSAGVMFAVSERTNGFEVPSDVWHSGYLAELRHHATRHIILANEIQSYDQDSAAHRDNLVALLAKERGIAFDSALSVIARQADQHMNQFRALSCEIAPFSSRLGLSRTARAAIAQHVAVLQRWVRGAYDWYDVTDRYAAACS